MAKNGKTAKTDPCATLAPHVFDTRVEALVPTIFFTPQVLEDMRTIVEECDTEVGWLGTVEKKKPSGLLVSEIFVPRQECHSATCRITTKGLMELWQEIAKRPNGSALTEKLLFWGHSHVRMDTKPSPQDDETMDQFRQNRCPYFVRSILNKDGRMEVSLFFFEQGVSLLDVPWFVECEPAANRSSHWRSIIQRNVKETQAAYGGYGGRGKGKFDIGPVEANETSRLAHTSIVRGRAKAATEEPWDDNGLFDDDTGGDRDAWGRR